MNSRPINPDFDTTPEGDSSKTDLGRRISVAVGAFLVWLISVVFIAVIPAIFLIPYLASQGVSFAQPSQMAEAAKNDPTAIVLQIAAIIPAHLLTLLLAYLVITRGRKYEFLKTLGWKDGGVRWWHYLVILGSFLVIAGMVNYFVPEQENDLIRILRSSRYAVYLIAAVATFSAPLIEEIIYRGVLFSAFQRALGIPAAFALVTFLFSLVHVPQYYPSISTILLLTLLSVTLTGLRVYSKNLLPCIILHTIFNGFQSIFLVLEPLFSPASQSDVAATIIGNLK